jgi:hypothetical protein
MSQIYFSKSANGFFVDGISPTIPVDKVPVTEAVWQRLIADQSPSSQLSADAAGNPLLIDPTQGGKVIWTSVGAS